MSAEDNEDDGSLLGGRVQAALQRLVGASRLERLLLSVIALVVALVIGLLFVFFSGYFVPPDSCTNPFLMTSVGAFCYDPFNVLFFLILGAVDDPFSIALTLQATTLLVFTGLSVAIAFRAGLFNIGTQGQMVLGALAAGLVGPALVSVMEPGLIGGVVVILGATIAAGITGGVYGAIPGALKAYADANEVITTIMLNIIASGVAFTVVSEYVNPGGNIQTTPLPQWARLTPILAPRGSQFSVIVLIAALLSAVGIYYLLNYSSFGYNVRLSGLQPDAADYSGVDAKRVVVSTMTLSGVLGGLAGAVFVLTAQGYWTDGLPAYGFDGITVSVLATNSPIGVIPAGLLFGILKSGAVSFQLSSAVSVPPQLVDVLRGIIVLLVAMPEFIRMLARRSGVRPAAPDATPEGEVSGDD